MTPDEFVRLVVAVAGPVLVALGSLFSGAAGLVEATGYTALPGECEPWCDGLTASGRVPVEGSTIACPRRLACPLDPDADWFDDPAFGFELGVRVWTPSLGVVQCDDRGGAIVGRRVDVYFDDRGDALAFGRRPLLLFNLRRGGSIEGGKLVRRDRRIRPRAGGGGDDRRVAGREGSAGRLGSSKPLSGGSDL